MYEKNTVNLRTPTHPVRCARWPNLSCLIRPIKYIRFEKVTHIEGSNFRVGTTKDKKGGRKQQL